MSPASPHMSPSSARGSAATNASTNGASSPLRGVLKKVHFHDDVDPSAKEGEKEGVKLTQHAKDAKAGSDKAVMPGTDVVVDAKTPLLAEGANEADDDAHASARGR